MALEAVQAQAGHLSIESTRVYLNPRELHQAGGETAGHQVAAMPG
jgi:hypothetical protein